MSEVTKPTVTHKPSELAAAAVFEGVYRGPVTLNDRFKTVVHEIETDTSVVRLKECASLKYNFNFVQSGDTVKAIFQGWRDTKSFAGYSFAVLKQLPAKWVIASTGKEIVGDFCL